MKSTYVWQTLMLLGLMAFSCEKSEECPDVEEDNIPRIEIGEPTLNVAADAKSGKFFYIVKNPIKGVTSTAVSDVEWIHDISVGGGIVSFGIDQNNDIERIGNIHMAYSDVASADVTIVQAASEEELSVYSSDLHFQFEGESRVIKGYSSRKWTLTGTTDWAKTDVTSGEAGYFTLNIDVMENVSKAEDRRTDFIFHLNNSKKTFRLSVSQDKDSRPENPSDSDPSNTKFYRKILLTDFCGTDDIYTPIMQKTLMEVLHYPEYSKKAVLASAHMYNLDDPAYFNSTLASAMEIKGYPTLIANLNKMNKMYANAGLTDVQQFIDDAGSSETLAGVAANSAVIYDCLYVNSSVKSAIPKLKNFRVAVWILEDGIYGKQKNALDESYNIHDNCVRAISGDSDDYHGVATNPVALAMREVGNASFKIELNSSWDKSKLRYLVVVSAQNKDGFYEVCNVDSARLGESIQYNYSEP